MPTTRHRGGDVTRRQRRTSPRRSRSTRRSPAWNDLFQPNQPGHREPSDCRRTPGLREPGRGTSRPLAAGIAREASERAAEQEEGAWLRGRNCSQFMPCSYTLSLDADVVCPVLNTGALFRREQIAVCRAVPSLGVCCAAGSSARITRRTRPSCARLRRARTPTCLELAANYRARRGTAGGLTERGSLSSCTSGL